MSGAISPNILFIMTDQQRFDAVGANGNPRIRTPHLDRLAAQSANFHSCYVQSPVCVPSRQTFFTGLYPHSHRNRVNYTPMDSGAALIQSYLKQSGYATASVGKLHYFPPTPDYARQTGFDIVQLHDGVPSCNKYSDYVAWLRQTAPEYADNYRALDADAGGNPYKSRIPDEYHETSWCGLKTREVLRELAAGEKPFFLFASFWRPHEPFELPEPWASMYDDADIPLPEPVSREQIESLPLPVQKMLLRSDPPDYLLERERVRWMYKSYYGAVSQIDREVGLTLDCLEELGAADNTIVVFCSDHGDQLMDHGALGKNVFFEQSVHIPLMIRFPGHVVPGTYDDLTESTDVLPTLFELAKLDVPRVAQGRSAAALISGGRRGAPYSPRQYVFAENCIPEVITNKLRNHSFEPGRGVNGIMHPDAKMIRSRRWKYNYYVDHGEELYDLAADPGETRNVAGDPAHTAVVREMKSALLDWMITADEAMQFYPRWCEIE